MIWPLLRASDLTGARGARIALAASLGAALWPGDGQDPEALLGAADRALYASKQAGRETRSDVGS